MKGPVVGMVTAKDNKEAEAIAQALVEKKLAACCNIIPNVKSVYRWKGRVENCDEVILIIKTNKELTEAVVAVIKSLHSYDMPAIEFLDVSGGSSESLEWMRGVIIGAGKDSN